MREKILCELVKEILGPRDGLNEILESSPLVEYITGVLAPANAEIERESEDQNLLGEVTDEEEGAGDYITSYPQFSPIVNPQKQPSSIGLSFMVRKPLEGSRVKVSICGTWGKYIQQAGQKVGYSRFWKREANYLIEDVNIEAGLKKIIRPSSCKSNCANTSKVSLKVFSRELESSVLVSIFLCNNEKIDYSSSDWKSKKIESYIFQPQIRVKLQNILDLQPFSEQIKPLSDKNSDDLFLSLLYRNTPVMARGHMCAGVWAKVDPETLCENQETEKRRPNEPPFKCVDIEILPNEEKEKFFRPDLRTEMVPLQIVSMPNLEWNSSYGKSPNFNASELSNCWSPQEIGNSIDPIIAGYNKFIDDQKGALDKVPSELRSTGNINIQQNEIARNRIADAIKILKEDEQARLAFCFLNKAMSLQKEWEDKQQPKKEKSDFIWRPFQLGIYTSEHPFSCLAAMW